MLGLSFHISKSYHEVVKWDHAALAVAEIVHYTTNSGVHLSPCDSAQDTPSPPMPLIAHL